MADPFLRPLMAGDIEQLAPRLRAADLAELQALHGPGVDVLSTLSMSVQCSDEPLVIDIDGRAEAVLGCAPMSLLDGLGVPWLLGSDALTAHPRFMVAEGRRVVAGWSARHRQLRNMVDTRNTRSIRWLRAIGFSVSRDTIPFGAMGLPFHTFERA